MRRLCLLTLLSLLTVLVACGSNVKHDARPDWVSGNDKRFPSTLYLTGRGSASRLDEASDRARADLAKIFEVSISEASTDTQAFRQESNGDGQTSSSNQLNVTREIEVRTGRVLNGVDIAESWQDPEMRREHCVSFVPEVIGINSLYLIIRGCGHTDSVIEHQLREARPIYKNDFAINARNIIYGIIREGRRGYENSLSCTLALQCACELLNLRPPHGGIPSLRLQVDYIQSKGILLDDAVNPLVA